MNSVLQTFSSIAPGYDAERRRLVPCFDELYGTALAALGPAGGRPERILDLGAGTGLLAAMVADARPGAALVLVDGAAAMLDRARAALGGRGRRVHFHVADLRDPLPAGDFDAIVSALAIHHLEDDEKRALFARAHAALRPGGRFVNAEQVLAPTPALARADRAWHRAAAAALGATPQEWARAEQRMAHDRLATVEAQLGWLREAGFRTAECLFEQRCFAVLAARR